MTNRNIDKPMNSREWTILAYLAKQAIAECTDPECRSQLELVRDKCTHRQLAAIEGRCVP